MITHIDFGVGDVVQCVNVNEIGYAQCSTLTVGQKYIVLGITSITQNVLINIINDNGVRENYYIQRFKRVVYD